MNKHGLLSLALFLAPFNFIACGSSPGPSGSGGTSSTSSASGTGGAGGSGGASGTGGVAGTGGTSTTTVTVGAGGGGGAEIPAGACEMAGGICLPQGSCVSGGGTLAPSSPGGCHFDDGSAECCVPPTPVSNPTTCAEAGGICAPIGGCLDAGGYFTSNDAGCNSGGSYACCVPHGLCGDQTIDCCTDSAVYNPACDKGAFVCLIGSPVPVGTCVVP